MSPLLKLILGSFLVCALGLGPSSAFASLPAPQLGEQPTEKSALDLKPIPEAPLDGLEPAVQTQLAEKRARLDALSPDADTADLIPAYGDLGQLFLLYDRPETAAVCFENVVRLAPGEPNAWYYLAVIRQDAGAFEEALAALAHVQEARPDDVPTLLRTGEMLFQLRRLDEAETAFKAVESHEDDSASAHFGLGRIANARRQWQEAVDRFRRTLELQPDADSVYHPLGLALRRLDRVDEAKAALSQAGPSAPVFDDPLMRSLFELTATSRSFFIEGNRARRRGLVQLAESYYLRALELDPTDASVLYNLGTLLGEQGRVMEAEQRFIEAVKHKPDHRNARFNLAVGLRARGELEPAVEAFRAVRRLDPNDPSVVMELGVTLIASGRQEEGSRLLKETAEGEIHDPQMGLQLIRYLQQTGHLKWIEDVVRKTERSAVRPEDRAALRLIQAEAALARQEPEKAVELLQNATAWDPENPKPVVRLALTFCLLGSTRQAIEALEQSREPLADNPTWAETLAKILATAQDPDLRDGPRALELAQKLFERTPGPQTAAALAMALAAAGSFDRAVALQERLLREVAGSAPPVVRQRLLTNLERYRAGQIALPPC